MIEQINFKFGSNPATPALSLDKTQITIFVGPNNSGKSLILREIKEFCDGNIQKSFKRFILDFVKFTPITAKDLDNEIEDIKNEKLIGATIDENEFIHFSSINGSDGHIRATELKRSSSYINLQNPEGVKFLQSYIRFYTLMLDGMARMGLVSAEGSPNFRIAPQTRLSILFHDNQRRRYLQQVVYQAFKRHLLIDHSEGGLRLCFSTEPAPLEIEHRLDKDAINFFKSTKPIDQYSDGVRAFIGTLLSVIAGNPRLILIDEPEAFLHPVLANNLGKEIGTILREDNKKQLIAATHSSHFLMGCIQSGVDINILRLTYTSDIPTVRLLPPEKITQLMRKPLLRSTGVLEALFYESVIVTEADTDRAFYQEINERLLTYTEDRGTPNCLFLNAQNKQTIWEIIKPLRDLGIPAAAIVDIDVIKDGGNEWTKVLDAANIPEVNRAGLRTERQTFKDRFGARDFKREGGINLLDSEAQEGFRNFLARLASYGVFVVPHGEVEHWLQHLEIPGHGPNWLISMFERMGENAASLDYIRPADDDVWEFMSRIRTWLMNPNRLGIPQ